MENEEIDCTEEQNKEEEGDDYTDQLIVSLDKDDDC
jgi:hypothetical protein